MSLLSELPKEPQEVGQEEKVPQAPPQEKSTDLFGALAALWTKERIQNPPPPFLLHRFLASDKNLASACRYIQKDLRGDGGGMTFRTWQGLLPKGRGAPRLSYVAPKKGPAAEELVLRIMSTRRVSREEAEEIFTIFSLREEETLLYHHFGMEAPDAE